MSTGKQGVSDCWNLICTALGINLLLDSNHRLVSKGVLRVQITTPHSSLPSLFLALHPVQVCVNGQLSLIMLGSGSFGLVVSCDLTTRVLTALVFNATDSKLNQYNVQSCLPSRLSLFQLYDNLRVVTAMYLKGTQWEPLALK